MDPLAIAALLIGLVTLDVAAWRWGVNSTNGPTSPEWERRRIWRHFGTPDAED